VQQRRDSHVFVAAVIEHNRGHAQQVRKIRNAALLAVLIAMHLRGKQKRMVESYGQRNKRRAGGLALRLSHRRISRRCSG
jgi:hypothetical protein